MLTLNKTRRYVISQDFKNNKKIVNVILNIQCKKIQLNLVIIKIDFLNFSLF